MKKITFLFLFLFVFSAATAQECYNIRLKNGITQYNKKNNDRAKALFESAKRCPDKPADGDAVLDSWIAKCKNQPLQDVFEVTPANLVVASSEGYAILAIKATGNWYIEDLPEWCIIDEQTDNSLKIRCYENEVQASRQASFKVILGRRSRTITIEQDACKVTPSAKIFFRTNVDHAYADFGTGQRQATAVPVELAKGEYHVRIGKENYDSIDTLVSVPGNGSTTTIDVDLRPRFALVKLDIQPDGEFPFNSQPQVVINNKNINFSFVDGKSINEAERVEYYKLYKDGYIAMPVGVYDAYVKLENFHNFSGKIETKPGVTNVFTVRLKPISGYLSITDSGNATGAKVFLDDRELCTAPVFKKEVPIGTHTIRIEKNGYLIKPYDARLTIEEGKETELKIAMSAFKESEIRSIPAGAEVFVNGEKIGYTPVVAPFIEGQNTICIKKSGYCDKKEIVVMLKDKNERSTFNFELTPTYPIRIIGEPRGTHITITGKQDTLSAATPHEFQLPYGKYKAKPDSRSPKRLAVRFKHDGKKKAITLPFYSRGTINYIAGNYYFSAPKLETQTASGARINYYNLMADLSLFQFNIAPGLSTSTLRASVFSLNEKFNGRIIDSEYNGENMKYPGHLFSGSCLFTNGDFRIGGYLFRRIGLCALASYAWNPNLTGFLKFNQLSGHEMFFGIEASSRIACFNANIKIGQKIYNGQYNYILTPADSDKTKVYSESFDLNNFTVSIGFTLGRQRSRSNNILVVW